MSDLQFWLLIAALVTLQVEIMFLRAEVSELKQKERLRASWEDHKARQAADAGRVG